MQSKNIENRRVPLDDAKALLSQRAPPGAFDERKPVVVGGARSLGQRLAQLAPRVHVGLNNLRVRAVLAVEPDQTVYRRVRRALPRYWAQARHRLLGTVQAEVAGRWARSWLRQLACRASRTPHGLAGVLRARARPTCFTAVRRAAVAPSLRRRLQRVALVPRREDHNRLSLQGRKAFKAEVV